MRERFAINIFVVVETLLEQERGRSALFSIPPSVQVKRKRMVVANVHRAFHVTSKKARSSISLEIRQARDTVNAYQISQRNREDQLNM